MKILDKKITSTTEVYYEYSMQHFTRHESGYVEPADPKERHKHIRSMSYFIELEVMDALALGNNCMVYRVVDYNYSLQRTSKSRFKDVRKYMLITDGRNRGDHHKIPTSLMREITPQLHSGRQALSNENFVRLTRLLFTLDDSTKEGKIESHKG